jgi:hypothetical protein
VLTWTDAGGRDAAGLDAAVVIPAEHPASGKKDRDKAARTAERYLFMSVSLDWFRS